MLPGFDAASDVKRLGPRKVGFQLVPHARQIVGVDDALETLQGRPDLVRRLLEQLVHAR